MHTGVPRLSSINVSWQRHAFTQYLVAVHSKFSTFKFLTFSLPSSKLDHRNHRGNGMIKFKDTFCHKNYCCILLCVEGTEQNPQTRPTVESSRVKPACPNATPSWIVLVHLCMYEGLTQLSLRKARTVPRSLPPKLIFFGLCPVKAC